MSGKTHTAAEFGQRECGHHHPTVGIIVPHHAPAPVLLGGVQASHIKQQGMAAAAAVAPYFRPQWLRVAYSRISSGTTAWAMGICRPRGRAAGGHRSNTKSHTTDGSGRVLRRHTDLRRASSRRRVGYTQSRRGSCCVGWAAAWVWRRGAPRRGEGHAHDRQRAGTPLEAQLGVFDASGLHQRHDARNDHGRVDLSAVVW